jgi:acetyltransferase-like isoleucine patch superfamily enzyme
MEHLDPKMRAHMRAPYQEIPFISVTEDVTLGERVLLSQFVNLYGCAIGEDTSIGAYTEIGQGVTIGKRCKIGAFCFIPPGVTIGDEVFIGPGTFFSNDRYPKVGRDWEAEPIKVEDGASIGMRCTILPGVNIGRDAMVAAGTIVVQNVADDCRVKMNLSYSSRPWNLLERAALGTKK